MGWANSGQDKTSPCFFWHLISLAVSMPPDHLRPLQIKPLPRNPENRAHAARSVVRQGCEINSPISPAGQMQRVGASLGQAVSLGGCLAGVTPRRTRSSRSALRCLPAPSRWVARPRAERRRLIYAVLCRALARTRLALPALGAASPLNTESSTAAFNFVRGSSLDN